MDLANELDVTPWEALLKTVRLCTGRMVQTELRLQHEERRHDGEEETSREVKYWRSESRRERMLAARASKAAIDAGVAERYVRQAEIEGSIVADALIAAFDSIPELTAQQRLQALTAAQSHLFAIEGTIVETNEKPDGELPPLMP